MRKPDRTKLVYFLRGLGIGIIVTVIILSIHAVIKPESKAAEKMTKEQIIEKAKEYGLVEPLDNKLDQVLGTEQPKESANAVSSDAPVKSEVPAKTSTPAKTATPAKSAIPAI